MLISDYVMSRVAMYKIAVHQYNVGQTMWDTA